MLISSSFFSLCISSPLPFLLHLFSLLDQSQRLTNELSTIFPCPSRSLFIIIIYHPSLFPVVSLFLYLKYILLAFLFG